MKKLLFWLLTPLLVFAATTPSTIPVKIIQQDETKSGAVEYTIPEKVNGYFILNTKEDLIWFSDTVNTATKSFQSPLGLNAKLAADIDFGGDYWVPIAVGNGDNCYSGTFDGAGFTISNLTLNTEWLAEQGYNIQNSGFIGSLKGTVKNLTLDNITVYSNANGGLGSTDPNKMIEKAVSVGAIVGWLNGGTADKITVTGNLSAEGTGVALGGIVGNAGGGKVTNSTSSVTIRSEQDSSTVFIGGIVGYTKKTPTLKNDVWNGTIIQNNGKGQSGGIAGYVYSGTVTVENVTFNKEGVESAVGKSCDACAVAGDLDYGVYKIYKANNKKICELDGKYYDKVPNGIFTIKDKVDSVVLNRTFNAGKYTTLSLPFTISTENIEGAKFYKLYDVVKEDGNYVVQLTEEIETVVANKPYIIITEGETISISGQYNLTSSLPDTNVSSNGNWNMLAIYKYTTGADRGDKRIYTYGFVAKDTVIDGKSWSSGQFARMGTRAYTFPFRVLLEYVGDVQTALAKSINVAEGTPDVLDIVIVSDTVNTVKKLQTDLLFEQGTKTYLKFNRLENRIEIIHKGKHYNLTGSTLGK